MLMPFTSKFSSCHRSWSIRSLYITKIIEYIEYITVLASQLFFQLELINYLSKSETNTGTSYCNCDGINDPWEKDTTPEITIEDKFVFVAAKDTRKLAYTQKRKIKVDFLKRKKNTGSLFLPREPNWNFLELGLFLLKCLPKSQIVVRFKEEAAFVSAYFNKREYLFSLFDFYLI